MPTCHVIHHPAPAPVLTYDLPRQPRPKRNWWESPWIPLWTVLFMLAWPIFLGLGSVWFVLKWFFNIPEAPCYGSSNHPIGPHTYVSDSILAASGEFDDAWRT